MHLRWFLRMARWARNPPTMRQVLFVLAILIACLALLAVELWIGWPDWATTGGGGRPVRF